MNRIKSRILGFLVIFAIFSGNIKAENSYILWKLSKGDATVYLAPTIHILPDNFYPLNTKVEEILEESDYLVVELDAFSDKTLQIIQNDGMKYMLNKDNKDLKELIEAKEYDEIREKMGQMGLELNFFSKLNPGVLTQVVIQTMLLQEGFNLDSGLDNYYLKKAKEKNKTILELEDPLYQLEKLFSLEFPLQLEGLKELLQEEGKKETIKTIMDFVSYVKSGDLENFEIVFKDSVAKDERLKKYYESILDERNIGMANKIETYLNGKGVYFVAVGAGHYLDKNSIRDILSKKGYKIERVKL